MARYGTQGEETAEVIGESLVTPFREGETAADSQDRLTTSVQHAVASFAFKTRLDQQTVHEAGSLATRLV